MADMILFSAFLLLAIISLSALAEDNDNQPSPELLEFLGEWETRDGEWFNPLWILKSLQSSEDKKGNMTSEGSEVKEND